MGKKKHKGEKHDRRQDRNHGVEREGHAKAFPLPLAGIAAVVTQQLQSPAARAAMATGLRAAADALSNNAMRPAAPPVPPQPPTPPRTDAPPHPDASPTAATMRGEAPFQGAARSPDPHEISVVLGKAAEQLLGAFLSPRKPR